MSSRTVEVSYPAYSGLLLHCAKHPASEVMGFLLGSATSSKVVVEKAIPVQHHWNRLSPMVEVAASLVSGLLTGQDRPWEAHSATLSGACPRCLAINAAPAGGCLLRTERRCLFDARRNQSFCRKGGSGARRKARR